MPRLIVRTPMGDLSGCERLQQDDTLAGEAYVMVRERILRGELAIGQVISRRKIATELGMALPPVAEALLRLEDEGLLESRPRAGTRVKVPTPQDVRDHYLVREALEVQAAMCFAQVATPEQKSELMKIAARVDALSVQEGNRFVYLRTHEKLHRRIAECIGSAALCSAIDRTSALASTWLCVMRAPSMDGPPRTHQNLVEGLILGDAIAAGEVMRGHIRKSMENTLHRLEPYFNLPAGENAKYLRVPKKVSSKKRAEKKPVEIDLPSSPLAAEQPIV